jgi:4-nitrophenyl phosphatase
VPYVLDLDGVVWLGEHAIPGAAGAIGALRAAGEHVVFVTNNSSPEVADQERKLERMGISATGDVVTSAMAAATLVEPGERVLVCAGRGVTEAVERRNAVVVHDASASVVVVGLKRDVGYEDLLLATRAVLGGARFIATNDDRTYPTVDGPIPGSGALVAAVSYATRVEPVVAGKPHEPMAALVAAELGASGGDGTVVGDRAETDGLFARRLGFRFALVLSGITGAADLPVEPAPDVVADDLGALVAREVQYRGA